MPIIGNPLIRHADQEPGASVASSFPRVRLRLIQKDDSPQPRVGDSGHEAAPTQGVSDEASTSSSVDILVIDYVRSSSKRSECRLLVAPLRMTTSAGTKVRVRHSVVNGFRAAGRADMSLGRCANVYA